VSGKFKPPARHLSGLEEKEAVKRLFDEAIEKGSSVLGCNGPQEGVFCREFSGFSGGGFADGSTADPTRSIWPCSVAHVGHLPPPLPNAYACRFYSLLHEGPSEEEVDFLMNALRVADEVLSA
jgi:hypothetical protein